MVQLGNSSGAVTKTYVYDAFGNEKNIVSNDTNPMRYCGEYFDKETGTIYLRARYYDAGIGRFISEDSVRGKANDPLSLNLYTYCTNNPVMYYDSNGHWYMTMQGGYVYAVMESGDTLSSLSQKMYNDPSKWTSFNYQGDPTEMAIGTKIDITKGSGNTPFSYGDHIYNYMRNNSKNRGWTDSDIQDVLDNPARTIKTIDTRYNQETGTRNNEAATKYYSKDGSYVVRNDRTGDIIQISDRNDPDWKDPDGGSGGNGGSGGSGTANFEIIEGQNNGNTNLPSLITPMLPSVSMPPMPQFAFGFSPVLVP